MGEINITRDFKGVWIPKEIWLAEDLSWTEKMLLVEIDSLAQNNECFATNEYFANFFGLKKDTISKAISFLKKKGYVEVVLQYKDDSKQILKRIIRPITNPKNQGEKSDRGIGEKSDRGVSDKNPGGIGEKSEGGIGEKSDRGCAETSDEYCVEGTQKSANNTIYNNTSNNYYNNARAREEKNEHKNVDLNLFGHKKNSSTIECEKKHKPTLEEIEMYCSQNNISVDPLKFFSCYEKKDWIEDSQMMDWKSRLAIWQKNRWAFQRPSFNSNNNFSYKDRKMIEQNIKTKEFMLHTGAPTDYEGDLNDWFIEQMDTFI